MKKDWTPDELEERFDHIHGVAIELMLRKNRDYGNSWAEDRPTTITDTMRHKLDRIRSLEEMYARGESPSIENEGIQQELLDIMNYACFRYIQELQIDRSPHRSSDFYAFGDTGNMALSD